MNKLIYILIMALACTFSVSAQPVDDLIRRAYVKYNEKDYQGAAADIDEVLKAKNGDANGLAWHIKGFIYKDIYIHQDKTRPTSEAREIAVHALQQALRFDTEGGLKEQNIKALNYLAASYFNDASDVIESREAATVNEAERYYSKYKAALEAIEPNGDFGERDIRFYLAMATAHRKIYEKDRDKYDAHYDMSNEYYMKVLSLDPNSFPANYSLAVSYYNKGAHNLEKLPELEIHDVIKVQGESMRSIQFALPFMLRAYEVNPERMEAVKGLKYIHFNLHDYEKSEQMDEKLEQMQREH